MRWDDFRRSDNVEDDRDGGGGFGGGGGGMPMGGGGLGIGTIIVLGLLGWALGIDPRILIGGADILMGGGSGPAIEQRAPQSQTRGRPRRRPTSPDNSSPPSSAIPRTSGARFSRRTARPTARRGCACSPA